MVEVRQGQARRHRAVGRSGARPAGGRAGAEQAGKPWLRSDADTPSYDDVRARIEADAGAGAGGPKPPRPTGEEGFDRAERERAASERLAAIRESLDLPKDDPPIDS